MGLCHTEAALQLHYLNMYADLKVMVKVALHSRSTVYDALAHISSTPNSVFKKVVFAQLERGESTLRIL